ncbi:hypothetical protein [Helicobacter sp. 11S02629-2]|uniref:hypothetical protein n=1 Tax=Helicobacter sp. 11S02629-2 TaxID=1476195 RepID=UPI000BA7C838|nr:hypothetical protein [Helicobacter sp. 11S02629-2]PAF45265.1 hypothetical protein BKH40_03450 [Helicobacter sp. 11S02629-2]
MRIKLMAFMSFIFIVFIVVFVLFFYNSEHQIKLFENGFTQTYYQNTTKTLKTSTDSIADSLGALVKGMDTNDQIALISKAISDIRMGGGGTLTSKIAVKKTTILL